MASVGAPKARYQHSAVWTGHEMIVFGGSNGANYFDDVYLYRPLFPRLGISRAGGSVIVSWPTNFPGFTLESRTDLSPPGTWNAIGPLPIVSGNNYVVTNSITGARRFYRLRGQ
jgi:hypothetical protein